MCNDPWSYRICAALLYLDEDLSDDPRLGAVTLNDDDLSDGDDLRVLGYGASEWGGMATDTLEYTDLQYVTDADCENQLNSFMHSHPNASQWNITNITLSGSMLCAHGQWQTLFL